MLSLLRPWHHLQDVKHQSEAFNEAYESFISTATQVELDILSGIQYHYDCRNAASARRDEEGDFPDENTRCQQDPGILENDHEGSDSEMMDVTGDITLTEEDLRYFKESRKNLHEERRGRLAVFIAQSRGLLVDESKEWECLTTSVSFAHGDDYRKLLTWQSEMASIISEVNGNVNEDNEGVRDEDGDVAVNWREDMDVDEEELQRRTDGAVENLANLMSMGGESDFRPVEVQGLLRDQQRAYDIIDWHLNETLNGNKPQQLLMIIPGEGGVGKSKTIQTITESFHRRGAAHLLAKSAYTGIAASIIDGKTLHVICQIPLNGRNRSRKANQKLAQFWQHRLYLIIDEKSMLSCKFFARISSSICSAKMLAGVMVSDLPFGGVSVILVGDFHQFPPVTG